MKTACGRTYRRRKSKRNLILTQQTHTDVYFLLKWIASRGYKQTTKLKPAFFEGSGRGLMADETIHPGEAVVAIPKHLLITPRSVLETSLGPLILKHCPNASGQAILSLFLMYEKSKGQNSPFHPYVSSLPNTYDTPAYFCDHAFAVMPKPIFKEAKRGYDLMKTAFFLIKPVLENLDQIFAGISSYDLFKWAWSSVNTRSVYMECEIGQCQGKQCSYHLALAPFLDLLNHSFEAKVTAGFDQEKNHYEIITHQKIKKYSQVFINYGCHDNLKLFIEYGFILKNNYNDHVTFSFDDIVRAYHFCSFDKRSLSKRLQFIADNSLLKLSNCSMDGVSWNLNIILKILSSAYDPKLWNSFLHQTNEELNNLNFKRLKDALFRLKIATYEMKVSTKSCSSKCELHLNLISELCSMHLFILKQAMN